MAQSRDEREQLRSFVLAVLDEVRLTVSEWALEPIRSTRSLRGLRIAANDMIEMCEDMTAEQVTALDARLIRDGLPTLPAMREGRHRSFLAILSRGRIASDDQFRLVSAYVSEMDSPHLSGETRSTASALMAAYESTR